MLRVNQYCVLDDNQKGGSGSQRFGPIAKSSILGKFVGKKMLK